MSIVLLSQLKETKQIVVNNVFLLDGSTVSDILLFMLLHVLARVFEQDTHFIFALGAAILTEVSKVSLLFLVYSLRVYIFDAIHLGGGT